MILNEPGYEEHNEKAWKRESLSTENDKLVTGIITEKANKNKITVSHQSKRDALTLIPT